MQAVVPRSHTHVASVGGFGLSADRKHMPPSCGCRGQLLPEALEVAYGLLRMSYLTFAWQQLQAASSWQAAEAALYLFKAVSLSVKTRALAEPTNSNNQSSAAAAALAADRQATQQLLAALFGQAVCSGEGAGRMLGAHPLLAQACCTLMQEYATWFGKAAEAPLEGAFGFLLQALHIPTAAKAAAAAFQALCLRCAWRLKDAATVGSLMKAARGILTTQQQQQQQGAPARGLAIADKQLVVEGLARIVAGLQGQQLVDAAAALTRPFIQQAQAGVAAAADSNGAGPSPQARHVVADGLRLLAAALRLIAPAGDDSGSIASQPVARVLEEAGPTLREVGESPVWQQDPEVTEAAVEVYHRAVCSARKHGSQVGRGLPESAMMQQAFTLVGLRASP